MEETSRQSHDGMQEDAQAVIIVAGGKGRRMGGDIPKQFIELDGIPILMRTINRFYEFSRAITIVVVLPKEQCDYWKELCARHGFNVPHVVTEGGKERTDSVINGLRCVADSCRLIGVHDGVRPFVSTELIKRCYSTAERCGAAVPVVDVVDSLRHVESDGKSRAVPRNEYKIVQTPQVFHADLLREAYSRLLGDSFTDDATVVEAMGVNVSIVEGERENIKITTPTDLTNHIIN